MKTATTTKLVNSNVFNSDFMCRVDGSIFGLTLHQLVGFALMRDLLYDKFETCMLRLEASRVQRPRFSPFHGVTFTFYRR